MINPGYKISSKDIQKLREFKKSPAYSTYLKGIAKSPAYTAIMDEHIEKINITGEIDKLKEQGLVPENIPSDALNSIFKLSLARMAIGIVTDTVVVRELEILSADEVINSIKEDSSIVYLLGMADKKFYDQAKSLLEQGKLSEESIDYRGLIAYTKRKGKVEKEEPKDDIIIEKDQFIDPPKSTRKKIDLSSNEIRI